jgi:hypothetical protein
LNDISPFRNSRVFSTNKEDKSVFEKALKGLGGSLSKVDDGALRQIHKEIKEIIKTNLKLQYTGFQEKMEEVFHVFNSKINTVFGQEPNE